MYACTCVTVECLCFVDFRHGLPCPRALLCVYVCVRVCLCVVPHKAAK